MIIFLNGPSSSGKTTIAKGLQKNLETPAIHIGTFAFMKFIHPKYVGLKDKKTTKGFYFTQKLVNGEKSYAFKVGTYGENLLKSSEVFLKSLISNGCDLIIEEVLANKELLERYLRILKNEQVYFIGVKCPLKIIEIREKNRESRIKGQSRGDFFDVHPANRKYDAEVDTSKLEPDSCVNLILKYIGSNSHPKSWRKLY